LEGGPWVSDCAIRGNPRGRGRSGRRRRRIKQEGERRRGFKPRLNSDLFLVVGLGWVGGGARALAVDRQGCGVPALPGVVEEEEEEEGGREGGRACVAC
jgi:hypothetical protein